MTGNTPITVEYVFGLVVSFLIALLWYWVRGISDGLKEARQERESIRNEIHKVKLDYATKQEATANQNTVMASLGRIDAKIDKLADKLDQKADKQ